MCAFIFFFAFTIPQTGFPHLFCKWLVQAWLKLNLIWKARKYLDNKPFSWHFPRTVRVNTEVDLVPRCALKPIPLPLCRVAACPFLGVCTKGPEYSNTLVVCVYNVKTGFSFFYLHILVRSTRIQKMGAKNSSINPDLCGSAGWAHAAKQKVARFDSRSGYVPGFQVQSLVGVHV